MPVQITILGLGRLGASIGLGLAKIKDQAVRIGNDREPGIMRQAEKMGAVDKTMINLPSAVKDADVVILALPVDEIRETIAVIAEDLKPGCVLVDTSPIKGAVMDWAKELVTGEDRYFVSLTPSLNPAYLLDTSDSTDNARADLFQNSLMLITSQPGIDESAITLATNLVQILGATPLFADVVEADGLMAYTLLLPQLISAALVNTTIDQSGWREARKMAGRNYAWTTEAVLHQVERKELGKSVLCNADNTVRVLNQMIAELTVLRDAISGKDEALLQTRLAHAVDGRETWLAQRRASDWEPKSQSSRLPIGGQVLGRLFGLRPKKDDSKK